MDPDNYTNTASGHFTNVTAGGTSTGIYISDSGGYSISPTTYTGTTVNTFNWIDPIDPMQKQINELQKFVDELKSERKLRKKYPALDNAYEQYEVMLELCKSKEVEDALGENSKGP